MNLKIRHFFGIILIVGLLGFGLKPILGKNSPSSFPKSDSSEPPTAMSIPDQIWLEIGLNGLISKEAFLQAYAGYQQMTDLQKPNILTIIDFSKPSTQKRLVILDLVQKRVLYHTLVAHGKNSGVNFAETFSNVPQSRSSSLGFYKTAETYQGRHGYSLRLDGLEQDINHNARKRAIVIHGADYVNETFVNTHGRLGRSWGCPALPSHLSADMIRTIANGSCLFIYANNNNYQNQSEFLKTYFIEKTQSLGQ